MRDIDEGTRQSFAQNVHEATVHAGQRRWADAEDAWNRALETCQAHDDAAGEYNCLQQLADLKEAQGDIEGARQYAQQGITVLEGIPDHVWGLFAQGNSPRFFFQPERRGQRKDQVLAQARAWVSGLGMRTKVRGLFGR